MALIVSWDGALLTITGGTSGTPITWKDVWDYDVDSTDVNGAGDTAGTPVLLSSCMTEHAENGLYEIKRDVRFGDTSIETHFRSRDELVYFDDGFDYTVTNNATLEIGDASGAGGFKGSAWSVMLDETNTIVAEGQTTATFGTYGSLLIRRDEGVRRIQGFYSGTWIARNLIYSGADGGSAGSELRLFSAASLDWIDVDILYLRNLTMDVSPDAFENVHIHDNRYTFYATPVTIEGLSTTDASTNDVWLQGAITLTLKDPLFTPSSLNIDDAGGVVTQQYTCNIHVVDQNGDDFNSSAVTVVGCDYAHLVEGSDSKTYKCITDHTSVDATHKPITGTNWGGFFELYDSGGGLGGPWVTTKDYKANESEFLVATDSNGDIAEQTIDYKLWSGASEVLEVRIHQFTFPASDGVSKIRKDVIVDHPLVWEYAMADVPVLSKDIQFQIPNTAGGQGLCKLPGADRWFWADSGTTITEFNAVGTAIDTITTGTHSGGLELMWDTLNGSSNPYILSAYNTTNATPALATAGLKQLDPDTQATIQTWDMNSIGYHNLSLVAYAGNRKVYYITALAGAGATRPFKVTEVTINSDGTIAAGREWSHDDIGALQGCCWKDGYIWILFDFDRFSGNKNGSICYLNLNQDGSIDVNPVWELNENEEAEGLCWDNSDWYWGKVSATANKFDVHKIAGGNILAAEQSMEPDYHWPLNDNLGSPGVLDNRGKGNGLLYNNNTLANTEDISGTGFKQGEKALNLDGTYKVVLPALGIPDAPLVYMTWINPDSNTGYIFSTRDDTVGGLSWFIGADDIMIGYLGASSQITCGQALTPGVWQHVALLYNGWGGIFYINGVKINSDKTVVGTWTPTAICGIGDRDSNNSPIGGLLSDMRVYLRNMSVREIKSVYEETLYGYTNYDFKKYRSRYSDSQSSKPDTYPALQSI